MRMPTVRKRDVFTVSGGLTSTLERSKHAGFVTSESGGDIQYETWEDPTAELAVTVDLHFHIFALIQNKPVDLSIFSAPDDVFQHARPTVGV